MALRFDPPPGWPAPPPGWQPPEGWQPDPEWPEAPEGWTFWVEDGEDGEDREDREDRGDVENGGSAAEPGPPANPPETKAQPAAEPEPAPVVYWSDPNPPVTWAPQTPQPTQPTSSIIQPGPIVLPEPASRRQWAGIRRVQWFGLAATLAVVLGSIVPFVSYEDAGLRTWQVRPGALVLSFLFGLLLTGLVVLTQQARLRTAACLSLLALGLLGFCGYTLFSVVGLTSGIQDEVSGRTVHWSPGPGLVLCIVGTAAAALLSVLILRIPKVSSS